jgi:hypothetical protein
MSEQLPAIPELQKPATPAEALSADNTYNLAVVIDNVVYQMMQTDGRNAAIFLANPIFIQVNPGDAQTGYTYDPQTGTFSAQVL